MDSKPIRSTFTASESKPVYGLPRQRSETTEDPRGSVRALVKMYENKIRENSQEAERSSVRNSSVGRLSQDKLSVYENKGRDSSLDTEKLNQRNSSVGRLTQDKLSVYENKDKEGSVEKFERNSTVGTLSKDKLQPYLVPDTGLEEDSRPRAKTENQVQGSWLGKLENNVLDPENKKEGFKLEKGFEVPKGWKKDEVVDKKFAQKIELKLEDLLLEKIEEKGEVEEKSVREVERDEKNKEKEKLEERSVSEGNWDEKNNEVLAEDQEKKDKHKSRKRREKHKNEIVIQEENENVIEVSSFIEAGVKIPELQLGSNELNSEINPADPEGAKKKSRKRSKKKDFSESQPESGEYIITPIPETKFAEAREDPQNDPQDFITFPPYIEQPFYINQTEIKKPELVFRESISEGKDQKDAFKPTDEENERKKSRKKSRKHARENKDIEYSQTNPETQVSDPFFQYIQSSDPNEFSQEIPSVNTSTLLLNTEFPNLSGHLNPPPKPPSLDSKPPGTSTSPNLSTPIQQEELILKASSITYQENDPFDTPTISEIQTDLNPDFKPSPSCDFSFKAPPNPISILDDTSQAENHLINRPASSKRVPSLKLNFPEAKLPDKSQSFIIEEIDVTCINCFECIRPEDIDAHSRKCLKPNLEVTESMQADIRIKKMLKSISMRKLESSGKKFILYSQLEEYSLAILEKSMNSHSISNKLEEIFIESLLVPAGLPLTILSRRLINLLELKGEFIIQQEEKDLLKLYQEEAERQRKELEKWKMRSELLLQLAGNPAGDPLDVNSELSSGRSSVVSFGTGFSDYPNDVGNLEDVEQVLQAISEEELEKHFYSICVRAKLSLPKHHPCADVPVSDFFKEVQRKNVPVSQWREYINTRFASS